MKKKVCKVKKLKLEKFEISKLINLQNIKGGGDDGLGGTVSAGGGYQTCGSCNDNDWTNNDQHKEFNNFR